MSEGKITNLRKYRSAIIYGEIGALLHDLGKYDGGFLKKHLKGAEDEYRSFNHCKIIEYDENTINNLGLLDFFKTPLRNLVTPTIPSSERMKKEAWNLSNISINNLIEKHEGYKPKSNEKLIGFIQIADRKDSADDRLMPLTKQEGKTYIASPFGKEKPINIEKLEKLRVDFYSKLADRWKKTGTKLRSDDALLMFRKEIMDVWKKLSENTVAETRRAANDVTLWAHSYATAAIMKALMVQDVINGFTTQFLDRKRVKQHFNIGLKILAIGWDASRILGEAQDLLGISGREQLIEKVKEKIKDVLEFEIPVGNCIYEDNNLVCFLVPENIDLVLEKIKRKVISEVTKVSDGVIIHAIYVNKKANPYPSKLITEVLEELSKKTKTPVSLEGLEMEDIKWVKEWDKIKEGEVCVECGKRPRIKDRDICWRCQKFRVEGIKKVKTGYTEVKDETLWLDEIADKNGNVALICGSILLEKWLNGELLKSMFIKTLDDITKENKNKLNKKLSNAKNVVEYFDEYKYSALKKVVEEFERALKEDRLDDAKKLIEPFLNFSIRKDPKKWDEFKENLQDIYTSIFIRASENKIGILEALFTKPPSPSRLLRIWNETQDFFNQLFNSTQRFTKDKIGGHCLRLKIKPRFEEKDKELFEEYQTYDLEKIEFDSRIKLPKTDLWWDGEYFYTTIRIENYTDGERLEEKQKIIKENIENLKRKDFPIILKVKKNINGKKKGINVKVSIEEIQKEKYFPIRKILVSPATYQVLLPADLAFDLATNYTKIYENEFSKVRGRLSLNLGCLFFKRKTPLFAVLDGSRRSVRSMKDKTSEGVSLKVKRKGKELEIISKSIGIHQPTWNVNTKLGNEKEDLYYPNLFVKERNKDKKTYFEVYIEGEPKDIINFSELDEDEIFIYPSLFDYQFLESGVDRFKLSFINQREHDIIGKNGPRPYLLEDIERFQRLKKIFEEIEAWSPIGDVEALAASKRQEWSNNGELGDKRETYKEFIETTLDNKLSRFFNKDKENWSQNIKPFLKECILEGSFFDVIELFKSIMKKRDLRGDKNV